MENCRVRTVSILLSLFLLSPVVSSWGHVGHTTICRIAQGRLSQVAASVVRRLLPAYARNDLGNVCSWADRVPGSYGWSRELHYINTPDKLCSYNYKRDCANKSKVKNRCVAGAIYNYTNQLLTYRKSSTRYNLTEALLFLSHFVGDIHQPLHVGFAKDRGGNAMKVTWITRRVNLHRTTWAKEVKKWESCWFFQKTCPDTYALESVKAACQWAYKDVNQNSVLKDSYFKTRYPIVSRRLAQAGVRLGATLNRIFKR